MIVVLIILIVIATVLLPFLTLWMLATLFDLRYEYTVKEWFAAFLLCLILVGMLAP